MWVFFSEFHTVEGGLMKGRGSFKLRVGDVKIYGGKVEICMWYF